MKCALYYLFIRFEFCFSWLPLTIVVELKQRLFKHSQIKPWFSHYVHGAVVKYSIKYGNHLKDSEPNHNSFTLAQ